MILNKEQTLGHVQAGLEIHYEPVNGGIAIFKNGQAFGVAFETFDALRQEGKIQLIRSWSQGHFHFRGRVDVYGLLLEISRPGFIGPAQKTRHHEHKKPITQGD